MTRDSPMVMHIDDEPDILLVTKLALEAVGGLDLVQFDSGRKAIEKAVEIDPDFILLDVMMPEMDGVETLRRLRILPGFEEKPVAFMTAKAHKEDQAALFRSGACAVIEKPFDSINISSEIIELWKAHLGRVT